jgi:NAD(P)-dependent dehydrogenase (short-subunit alcohol dehydrogenase family)
MYTQGLHVDDLQSRSGSFDGRVAYSRSKRAEVVLAERWAQELAGTGVVVHSMHPGWADTPGVRSSLPRFYGLMKPLLRTAEQGADTIVWLGAAAKPAQSSGGFWHDRRRRPTHLLPWTRESDEDRATLWAECVRLSGLEKS